MNTANYEMNFTNEEIWERFVRGDTARTTDGNGLGLAIAKTYTEASKGIFDIVTEGINFLLWCNLGRYHKDRRGIYLPLLLHLRPSGFQKILNLFFW